MTFGGRWEIIGIIAAIITAIAVIPILLKNRKRRKIPDTISENNETPDDKWPEENYEFITGRIRQLDKKYKSILFASAQSEALPVTIPVNVAIGLAKSNKRCLLIDLDANRNAVAEVFDLDSSQTSLHPEPVKTDFENLWVWPAYNLIQQINIGKIVEKTAGNFDFILINAPSLTNYPDCGQVISAAEAAFICSQTTADATQLAGLMKSLNCVIIGHVQIPS